MVIPKIHSSNLMYLGICAVGMIAFVLVGILPNWKAGRQLDENIAQLDRKVQAQELLHPIYMDLIKQIQQKTPEDLPIPQPGKIEKNNLSDINALFSSLGEKSGVAFENAAPDPRSYLEDARQLIMNVTYNGDFFKFRDLLLNLCKMPALRSIEQMQVKTEGDVKRLQLKIVLDQ